MSMILEIRELRAGYATGTVLRGVTMSAAEGEVVALLGRNGMGKTTLLRALCGLAPPISNGGSIRFGGEELLGVPSHRIAQRGVSLVPQGRRVFRSLTVEENLRIAARPSNDGWDLERVYDLFPSLTERRRHLGANLSGGEQQMLSIGRALMMNPRLLAMDEPSEGLAPTVRQQILERLHRLKRTALAVLLAEQNVDFALHVADRVSVIDASGTIGWSGEPAELRHDPRILAELIGF
jgi:branched-chain amino acid transport system ATP-binding protein